jgi:predicted kinase
MNTLVIFSGLPGTGKSTLANRLARELGWPLLCIDDVVGEIPANPDVEFWDSKVAILLDITEAQLRLGLSVIVDSVFMNTDRQHAQHLARDYGARFRPIYVFVSDDKVWEQRVTARYNEMDHKDVATWERIQHQRGHFREWELNTALFIDSLNSFAQNYESVLNFATKDTVELKPLMDVPLVRGNYHV